MSEETQSNNQQTIVIALVVVAVLLAAIVGVMIWQKTKVQTALPTPTASAGTSTNDPSTPMGAAAAGSAGAPAGMGSNAAPVEFDAKTATKVPAGKTPEDTLKTYGELILAGKYADAYKLLPLDKQQSYGDAAAYEAQVKAYGITAFNMGTPAVDGDTTTIVSEQVTPDMPITYTWTFKKVGDQWFVASRTMGGSLQ